MITPSNLSKSSYLNLVSYTSSLHSAYGEDFLPVQAFAIYLAHQIYALEAVQLLS